MSSVSKLLGSSLLFAGAALFAALPQVSLAAPKDFYFSSDAKANIFADTSGELLLHVPEADAAGTTIVIVDETGTEVGKYNAAKLPQAEGGAYKLALPHKGFYKVKATRGGEAEVKSAETSAAVIGEELSEELRKQSRLGLWTVQGDDDLVVTAGGNWNRRMFSIHTLEESIMDETPPPQRQLFRETPFTQVGVMSFGLPMWMMPEQKSTKRYGNPTAAPKDWDELHKMIANWARSQEKFSPYLEVYNEPEWQWRGTKEDLVRFLATIADGVREAHPDVKIFGPGFSSIRINDPARLDLATSEQLGLFDHLDGVVVHAYVDGTPPEGIFIERVLELQNWMKEIGRGDMPIHITEFGWTSGKGTWQKPVDELTQARYVARSLTLLAAAGIENSTYFCLNFKAAPNLGERGFSLVESDSSLPKPGYSSFATVSRWLAGVTGKGTWLKLTPTTHLILFEKTDGSTIAVAWDTEGERSIGLPLETIRRESMTGVPLPQSERLDLSPSPVYLEFSQAQKPEIQMLPVMKLMRGAEAGKLPAGKDWIAPLPLQIKDGRLIVPAEVSNGDYLLLAKSDTGWVGQPIEVIPPLAVSTPVLKWPADSASPELSIAMQSFSQVPITVRMGLALKGVRDVFTSLPKVQPEAATTVTIPLSHLVQGKRYQGNLTVDSRYDGKRDLVDEKLDLTVLSSQRVPTGRSQPDWENIPAVDFSEWEPFGGPIAPEDCSATFQSAYGARGFYLRIAVTDDEHVQNQSGETIWNGDSIQIGLDPDFEKSWEGNDLFGLNGHRVFEYGVAWSGKAEEKPMTWRWISYLDNLPVGQPEPRMDLKVTREGTLTVYEVMFPWEVLGMSAAPQPGTAIGIALSVADKDTGKTGKRALCLFSGIISGKDAQQFGPVWLR